MKNNELTDAVAHLIRCRDFCGDEVQPKWDAACWEALAKWQEDNDVRLNMEEKIEIYLTVKRKWDEYRKQAGVPKKYITYGAYRPNARQRRGN